MAKILKFIEQIMPIVSLYPRWAQFIFIVAFIMVAVSFVIFVILYPSISKRKKQNATLENINCDISVNNEYDENTVSGYFDATEKETLRYLTKKKDGEILIDPQMNYLDKLASGGPISGIEFSQSPFKWQFPNLDIKIVNKTDKTIFFTDAVFEIKKSIIDPWPIIVIGKVRHSINIMHFLLINEGWGDAMDCKINFSLALPDEKPQFTQPFKHTMLIGNIADFHNVNISDALKNYDVDVKALLDAVKKYQFWFIEDRKALGKFKDGVALVFGEIEYKGRTIEHEIKKHKVKFFTRVSLLMPGPGAPVPPSYQYQAMFEVNKSNYTVEVPISHAIKPNDADRFNILIGTLKSSHHSFRLKLAFNKNKSIMSPNVKMSIFLPKSQVERLKSRNDIKDAEFKIYT